MGNLLQIFRFNHITSTPCTQTEESTDACGESRLWVYGRMNRPQLKTCSTGTDVAVLSI